ncbi:MAG: hypothetical protein JW944_02210 [Deltaproteobacteria bacterium]|nr:hypothetical protein [Deltaproteobacteria bacterium]
MNDTENTCIDFKKACELGDCRGFEALQKAGQCNDMVVNPEGFENAEGYSSENIID